MDVAFIAACGLALAVIAVVIANGWRAGRRLTRADHDEDAARKVLCLRRGWRFRREGGGGSLDAGPAGVVLRLPALAWRVSGETGGGRAWEAAFRHERDPDAVGGVPELLYVCPAAGRPHEILLAHADEVARMGRSAGDAGSALETLATLPDGQARADALRRLLRDGTQHPATALPGYVWVARRPETLAGLADDGAIGAALAAALAGLEGAYLSRRWNAQAFWLAWQRDGLAAGVRSPFVPAATLGAVIDLLNGLSDRAA